METNYRRAIFRTLANICDEAFSQKYLTAFSSIFNPLTTLLCSHHVETNQLIYRADQLTVFYMIGTLVVKGSSSSVCSEKPPLRMFDKVLNSPTSGAWKFRKISRTLTTLIIVFNKLKEAYQRVSIVYSENKACFLFLKPSYWDSPFCYITDGIFIEK